MPRAQEEPHDVETLLRLLSTRMPWTPGYRVVTAAGLHASRGWSDTITAFKGHSFEDDQLATAAAVLESAFVTHTYVGNKQVLWYDMERWNPEQRNQTLAWGRNLDIAAMNQALGLDEAWTPTSVPYTQDGLGRRGPTPKLVEVSRIDERLYFLYFCVRTYAIRETINLEDLDEERKAGVLGEYQELIGVKRRHVPCFDCCVLDLAAERLELRVDFVPEQRSEEQGMAPAVLLQQMNRVFMSQRRMTPAGYGLINFFPAVNRIYVDGTAGRVFLLNFVATGEDTSSKNSGRPIRKRGQDLRKDKFHLGGKGNVEAILPYAIGARWDSPELGAEPLQIEILGQSKHVYLPNATVNVANFTGCMTSLDYDFLVGELSRHLHP
jgi:hypothetical protein